MAYGLPVFGEDDQTTIDKFNNSIEYVKAVAEAAQSAAAGNVTSVQAASQAADQALERAESAHAFIEEPTDGRVAELVADTSSSTGAALSAAYASKSARGQIAPWATTRRGGVPQIVSLIVGNDDEAAGFARVGFNVPTVDTVNTKVNGRAWKFVAPGGTTNPNVVFTPPGSPVQLANPAQAVCVWVHIPDVTGITGFNINLRQGGDPLVFLSRGTAAGDFNPQPLVNGWNFLRFPLGPVWKPEYTGAQVQAIDLICKGESTITPTMTVGHVYLECPPKARMVFILDRGYRSFILNGGLARCRELGIPITWAIDVTAMGGAVGTGGEAITLAEVRDMWEAGDSISFHGYTGDPTSTMTDAQTREDTMRSIRYLASQGYEGRIWRAAWVQNDGNPAVVEDLMLGQAFSNPSAPVVWPQAGMMEAWPPHDMHNIQRWVVQGASRPGDPGGNPTFVDEVFAALKATHGTIFPYFHGILGPEGSTGAQAGVPGNDATLAQWNYFADKVEAAITEGWLEPTTFEALWFESGGSFSTIGGGTVATWTDPDGTARTKHLP